MLAIFGEKLSWARFRTKAKSVSQIRLVGVTNDAKMNFSEVRKAANGKEHKHQFVTAMLPNKNFEKLQMTKKLVR